MTDDVLLANFLRAVFTRKAEIPGKKAFQKLLYLSQALGFPSNYVFRLHFYGPYSQQAASALEVLKEGGAVSTGMDERIRPTAYLDQVAAESPLPAAARNHVVRVLHSFGERTPMDLELLATTHFMWQQERRSSLRPVDERVVNRVRRYKAEKFTEEEIRASLADLRAAQVIN